jgi:hypothetical protein
MARVRPEAGMPEAGMQEAGMPEAGMGLAVFAPVWQGCASVGVRCVGAVRELC